MIIVLYLIPLFFLALFTYKPLTNKNAQVLLLMGLVMSSIAHIALNYSPLYTILAAIIGEISHILYIGLFGEKSYKVNGQVILLGVGLFPIFQSITATIIYITSIIILVTIFKLIKIYKSGLNYSTKTFNKNTIKNKVSTANYSDYVEGRKMLLLLPFVIANLITIVYVFISIF